MYAVDWGDGENTVVSGVEMMDRRNVDNPHSLYHLYSYWDIKAKASAAGSTITCAASSCTITPKIKIKDNWGWCNDGTVRNECDQWESYGGVITINE